MDLTYLGKAHSHQNEAQEDGTQLERMLSLRLDRRHFLRASGSLTALAAMGQLPGDDALTAPGFTSNPSSLGVASGDPLPDSVVLWTRLVPKPFEPEGGMPTTRSVPVQWQVAADEKMQRVVRKGTALARLELAHSVHVEVEGLEPAREYYYQFKVGNSTSSEVSPVGRTKTAPTLGARVARLRFAFASCQHWSSGYYSAYRRMAEEDLDLVVHLGDYLYEGGIDAHGGVRRVPVPDQFRSETVTLERYRLQYALYKSDPDLQKAHARFPWIVTWDDHEVVNDYAGGAPRKPGSPEETLRHQQFLARRAAAYQAYYEHMPLRRTAIPQRADMLLYRRLTWGDLAEFSVLDTRQYRSDFPCGRGEKNRCAAAMDSAVSMTGVAQERWLLQGLERSDACWNVLAQQVLMAQLDHNRGADKVFWQDSWDGYPGARQRILNHLAKRRVPNPVVITGDWHSTFVNDLKLDFDNPDSPTVATEFVGTSISSNGDEDVYGPYYGPMIPHNPHIRFFDGDRRGYVRCTLDHGQWKTDLRMVTTVSRAEAPVYTLASFAIENGKPGAQLDTIYNQKLNGQKLQRGESDLLPGGMPQSGGA
jgi:alkaline phosphatase D